MLEKKPLILVTNDDGITAPGIRHLINLVADFAEVVVVAPDSPRSAMSHAVTIASPIRLTKISQTLNKTEYACSGTPADCVKIAKHEILTRLPDLCVSGINHGSNASVNVMYSGTMGAAIEASADGIPSVGFSLLDYSWEADFTQVDKYILDIIYNVLNQGLPQGVSLNVNIPNLKKENIKGLKVSRQANGRWKEKFQLQENKTSYTLTGEYTCIDYNRDTDIWALDNGYISVVPIHFDFTAHQYLNWINEKIVNE